jgi:hypothetical protein
MVATVGDSSGGLLDVDRRRKPQVQCGAGLVLADRYQTRTIARVDRRHYHAVWPLEASHDANLNLFVNQSTNACSSFGT